MSASAEYYLSYGSYVFPDTFHPADDNLSWLLPLIKSLRRHGAHSLDACLREKRLMVRGGLIKGPMDRSDVRNRIDALRAALAEQPQNLTFYADRYWRNVKVEDLRSPYAETHFNRIADDIEILFVADDPFQYRSTQSSYTWSTPTDSETQALSIGGNALAQPVFTMVVGGFSTDSCHYTIENQTTNEAFTLLGVLSPADVIEIDTLNQTVTVNDTDSTAIFDGQFPHFETGTPNTLLLGVLDGTLDSIVITWRDRWY